MLIGSKEQVMLDDSLLSVAVKVIHDGGVIAYPTESVWGVGCNPWNKKAVQRLLAIKDRDESKGLIMIAGSEKQLNPLLENLNDYQRQILKNTWPGFCTWLIPDEKNWVPTWVKGQFDSVAVRIVEHPLSKALCDMVGYPIISTSANLSGKPPVKTESDVRLVFSENQVDYVLSGITGQQSQPSEIRDLVSGTVIRLG